METYLAIMTTALVITQIIRLIQNTVSLKRQAQLYKKQLDGLQDITNEDIENQRRVYELAMDFFEGKGE